MVFARRHFLLQVAQPGFTHTGTRRLAAAEVYLSGTDRGNRSGHPITRRHAAPHGRHGQRGPPRGPRQADSAPTPGKRPARWFQLHTCPPNLAQTRMDTRWMPLPNYLDPCCIPPVSVSYLPALRTEFPHAQVFGCVATHLEVGSAGMLWSGSRAGTVMPCILISTCTAALRGHTKCSRVVHSSPCHHLHCLPYAGPPIGQIVARLRPSDFSPRGYHSTRSTQPSKATGSTAAHN